MALIEEGAVAATRPPLLRLPGAGSCPCEGCRLILWAIMQREPSTMAGPSMAERRGDDDNAGGSGVGVATRTRAKTKQPTPYRVLMLNDDYTPMEFVVLCLQRFFRMSMEEATRVMLHVHQKGVGVCGVFSYEVAETKVGQVIDFARQNQHPLQCTLEKA
jgi:ATP-dependent Clp protease adaptor protein ClpS